MYMLKYTLHYKTELTEHRAIIHCIAEKQTLIVI